MMSVRESKNTKDLWYVCDYDGTIEKIFYHLVDAELYRNDTMKKRKLSYKKVKKTIWGVGK